MRRLALLVATVLAALVAVIASPALASAYNPLEETCKDAPGSQTCAGITGENPLSGPGGAIVSVTSILSLVAGVVCTIFLIIGGIKYITSNGESSNIASAKNTITAALIGLVICALARPIILFVVSRL